MLSAAFISDKREREQHKDYDQDDALFVFLEVENPEEAFHFFM